MTLNKFLNCGFLIYKWGFPCGSAGKKSACNVGDLGLIPGLGRSPGEGKGHPLQYSGLENSVDCMVHGVAKSRTSIHHWEMELGLFSEYFLFPLNSSQIRLRILKVKVIIEI